MERELLRVNCTKFLDNACQKTLRLHKQCWLANPSVPHDDDKVTIPLGPKIVDKIIRMNATLIVIAMLPLFYADWVTIYYFQESSKIIMTVLLVVGAIGIQAPWQQQKRHLPRLATLLATKTLSSHPNRLKHYCINHCS